MNKIRKMLWDAIDNAQPPLMSRVREMLITEIREWLEERCIDAKVRINRLWFSKDAELLLCSSITIWSTFGVMDENRYANRISVGMSGRVREHHISTYEGFLPPFPAEFAGFIRRLFEEIQP